MWALLLSPTAKVRRRDDTGVSMSMKVSWKQEFIALWRYLQDPKVINARSRCCSKADSMTDVAYLCPIVLFFLLWRNYGNLPILALLGTSSSSVIFARA